MLHGLGEGIEISLLRGIVFVREEVRDDPWGGRGHEDLLDLARPDHGLQGRNIPLHSLFVFPHDWPCTGWLRNRGRTLARGDKIREVGITEPRAGADQPFALEASEAFFDIRGILGALLLAVIDHVEAHGGLLLHNISHRSAHTLGKGSLVQWTTFLTQT